MGIEKEICSAVDIIVKKAVSELSMNRTIEGTIIECSDKSLGKYKIKYQDGSFYAFSSSIDVKYSVNEQVYIELINNDWNKNKLIKGSVDKLGTNYLEATSLENGYTKIGIDCLQGSAATFSLSSYHGEELKDLTSSFNIDARNVLYYAKKANKFSIGMKIKTIIESKQRYSGEYGMLISMTFKGKNNIPYSKDFIFNTDNMTGNSYEYLSKTYQSIVLDIDGANLISIDSIKIYSKDFNYIDLLKADDIFFSDVELYFLDTLSSDELNNYSLGILTPDGGFFKETDITGSFRRLQAEVKVKGEVLSKTNKLLKYYWFLEDVSILNTSQYYSTYGGKGWKCLNQITKLTDEIVSPYAAATYQIIPGTYEYKVLKYPEMPRESSYKCVAVYNGETVLSKEIVVTNYNSSLNISIISKNGTQFYFDNGSTELSCKVLNGTEDVTNAYHFNWASVDVNGVFRNLTTVVANKLPVAANTITKYTTYKCSVFNSSNTYCGTASVIIYNGDQEANPGYSLIINNGTQIFKYNEKGISPCSKASTIENPLEIPALTFSVYDTQGNIVDNSLCTCIWTVPTKNTLIDIDTTQYTLIDNGDGTSNILNVFSLVYKIENSYNTNKTNNEIKLLVNCSRDGIVLNTTTNLLFTKEGENGTNGTDFFLRLEPNVDLLEKDIDKLYCLYQQDASGTKAFNYEVNINSSQLKPMLYENGVVIEQSAFQSISWELLKQSNTDVSAFEIDAATGRLTIKEYSENNTCNIVKVAVKYNDNIYYATYPVDVYWIAPYSDFNLKMDGGYRFVEYSSDGRKPQYDNSNPFKISLFRLDQFLFPIDVTNNYTYEWSSSSNLDLKKVLDTSYNLKPEDSFDGYGINNFIKINIKNSASTIVGRAILPIHLFLNRFGFSNINSWDGNSVKIDTEENYILAPQIGAGEKDSNNRFTGVVMGVVKEAANVNKDIGLFGYAAGARSFSLDAKTGVSKFGTNGKSQIILDPSNDKAEIYSGNYYYGAGDKNPYNTSTTRAGMKIDFTTPQIKFGTGNFEVNSSGHLTAKGGGSIAGWEIKDLSLSKGNVGISSDNSVDTKEAFWAGNATPSAAKFRVLFNGDVYASNLIITGGSIKIGTKFEVNSAGLLKAVDGDFSGKITSSSGVIGGWTIGATTLTGGDMTLNSNGSMSGIKWNINTAGVATFEDVNILGGSMKEATFKYGGTTINQTGIATSDGFAYTGAAGATFSRLVCSDILPQGVGGVGNLGSAIQPFGAGYFSAIYLGNGHLMTADLSIPLGDYVTGVSLSGGSTFSFYAYEDSSTNTRTLYTARSSNGSLTVTKGTDISVHNNAYTS